MATQAFSHLLEFSDANLTETSRRRLCLADVLAPAPGCGAELAASSGLKDLCASATASTCDSLDALSDCSLRCCDELHIDRAERVADGVASDEAPRDPVALLNGLLGLVGVPQEPASPCARRLAAREESPPSRTSDGRRRRRQVRGEVRIAACLQELERYNSEHVLRVSGLAKLGEHCAARLREYLERHFGPVEAVLLGNSTDARSIMGFAVLRYVEDAAAVLQHGRSHEMPEGAVLTISAFQHQRGNRPLCTTEW